MKKRILFISESVDFISGAEKSMLEIISLFDRKKFECFIGKVKSKEFREKVRELGVKQIDIMLHENHSILKYLWNIFRTIAILKKNKIDLIYITSSGNYWKPAEILAAKVAGVPVITHMRWWKYLLSGFLRYSDKIISNSNFTASRLLKSKYRSKSEVVMNFVDVSRLKVKREKNKKIIVSYIGQINPVKGIKYMIDAAREIKNADFLIVGRDAGAYLGYKDKMKEYAKGLSSVRFLDYTDDVSSIYNKTDILVLPSLEEPFGRVLVEAGYFGIPCIATKVGGIPEVINENTGILVEPKDSKAIKDAIVKLAKNSKLREKMGKEAMKKVKKEFDPKKQVREIEEICLRLTK